jgi:hypothetical protein
MKSMYISLVWPTAAWWSGWRRTRCAACCVSSTTSRSFLLPDGQIKSTIGPVNVDGKCDLLSPLKSILIKWGFVLIRKYNFLKRRHGKT